MYPSQSDLQRILGVKSGDPFDREDNWFDDAAKQYLYQQTTRLYEEYLEAVQRETPEGEKPPEESEIESLALTYIMELIFEAGYELGQEDVSQGNHGLVVQLDQATAQRLVGFALNRMAKE